MGLSWSYSPNLLFLGFLYGPHYGDLFIITSGLKKWPKIVFSSTGRKSERCAAPLPNMMFWCAWDSVNEVRSAWAVYGIQAFLLVKRAKYSIITESLFRRSMKKWSGRREMGLVCSWLIHALVALAVSSAVKTQIPWRAIL